MDPSHRILSVSPTTRATFSTIALAPEAVLLMTADDVKGREGGEY